MSLFAPSIADGILKSLHAGLICGLALWWARASARQVLMRFGRDRVWRPSGGAQAALFRSAVVGGAGFLAAGTLGRPAWALWFFPIFPLVFRAFLVRARKKQLHEMEKSCLPALQALHGFLASGLNLSASLLLLEGQRLEFSKKVNQTLRGFDRGRPLSACLTQFLRRTPSPLLGRVVTVLLAGYASGLPLLPFVEQARESVDRHLRREKRVGRLRGLALAQGAFAFAMPWALLGYLAHCQGEAFFLDVKRFGPIALGCLLWEVGGLFLLMRSARYE